MKNITHIGDGIYAYFNGYSIELKVNDHRNPTVVVLDPGVLESLNNFYKQQLKQQEDEKTINKQI